MTRHNGSPNSQLVSCDNDKILELPDGILNQNFALLLFANQATVAY